MSGLLTGECPGGHFHYPQHKKTRLYKSIISRQIFKPVACRRVSNGRLSTREMHWRSVIPLLHIQENTSHGGSTNGGLALVFPFSNCADRLAELMWCTKNTKTANVGSEALRPERLHARQHGHLHSRPHKKGRPVPVRSDVERFSFLPCCPDVFAEHLSHSSVSSV